MTYDADTDMVTIAEDLMVPVPVYNYAKYIKKVRCWSSYTMLLCVLTWLVQNFVSLCPDGQVEEVGLSRLGGLVPFTHAGTVLRNVR